MRDDVTVQQLSRDWGRSAISFVRLVLKLDMRNNGDFVDILLLYGPGSSVGIATDYGLDGPGSNPGRD